MNQTTDRSQITDKELHYIKDMLSWELLAMKKCNELASQCQNPSFQTLINQVGMRHEQQYNAILSHLQ